MEFRNLGRSGLQVSVVGLGCNNFGMRIDLENTKSVVNAALDAGINLFDTADVYGGSKSEEFLGIALGEKRHDVVVATSRCASRRVGCSFVGRSQSRITRLLAVVPRAAGPARCRPRVRPGGVARPSDWGRTLRAMRHRQR